ncbi:transglycosylase SLT domain-containing protein [Sphingomonas sp. ID0503]|uniref:lytic transglycosylase domain-containing protein n=1 Tax=Sphingomonas sp. ID0503 TaxID=3399691 RepID=UPI003AFAF782
MLALAVMLAAASPALSAPAETIVVTGAVPSAQRVPAQLTPSQRSGYVAVFAALRAGRWADAKARLDGMEDGPLHPAALAELYLSTGAPSTSAEAIAALLQRAPELPEGGRLAAIARKRGVTDLPAIPEPRALSGFAGAPRREAARSVTGDAAGAQALQQIRPLLKDDRPAEAEALLAGRSGIGDAALTELRQRIGWSYLLNGDDAAALRLSRVARGGSGEWVVPAAWSEGLAAWRMGDCAAAGDAFSFAAGRGGDAETMSAGLFWAARADMACGRADRVQARLRSAARLGETFYGLLARHLLGMSLPAAETKPDFIRADFTTVADRPNIRTAAALVEIGELGLADQFLRHQARIGTDQDHAALLRVAARLNLPATQIWLAHNGPSGSRPDAAARYPAPNWLPEGGWRVDRALVFAHALQESAFRTDAVSRAGARGLMQVLPTTVQLMAKRRGTAMAGDLADPVFNMECGQTYLEQLRDGSATGGLLPKVIAAYNAGPGAIARWNAGARDESDPLMFIETIPYAETRGYVTLVLRNYWMYQAQAETASPSLDAIAQGMWPRFPGLPGATAVRRQGAGAFASNAAPAAGAP